MYRTTLASLRSRHHQSALAGVRLLVPALVLLLVLTACGDDEDAAEPTAAATLTPVSIVSGEPPRTSPVPDASGGTAAAGQPSTVGELAERVDAAWSGVTSYRATTTNGGSGGVIIDTLASPVASSPMARAASPGAAPEGLVASDEVVMPSSRHQIVREAGAQSEFFAVDGLVYTRGAYNRVYIDAAIDPATWVELDPATVPPNTPLRIFVERFAGPEAFTSPFANLQPSTLASPLTPLDVATVDGRTCQSYRVVQTTQTGERVDVTLAVDEQDLPCYEETSAGGIVNRTTYGDFNAEIVIEPPADAMTPPGLAPSGSPAASPMS